MAREKPKPQTKKQRQQAADDLNTALDANKKTCPDCGGSFGAAMLADHRLMAHGKI